MNWHELQMTQIKLLPAQDFATFYLGDVITLLIIWFTWNIALTIFEHKFKGKKNDDDTRVPTGRS